MKPEIIIKRMVGECSSSVTDSTGKARIQRLQVGNLPPATNIII